MKTLIILYSSHHHNTEKVAKMMAQTLDAIMKTPQQIIPEEIEKYDLIGFGSGIYNQRHHQRLFDLVNKLPIQNQKKAFVFSTSTFGMLVQHKQLKEKLIEKGFNIVGEFSCPGFMNYSFIKYFFGGISKGRPNAKDIQKATEFAKNIHEQK